MENRYPRLEINLAHLQHNVSRIVEKCGSCGIQVAGVIKGATGHPEVAKAFDKGGAAFISFIETRADRGRHRRRGSKT